MKKKPLGVYDLLGMALGCIGLSFDDFCILDYEEFESICSAWHENAEAAHRGEWERMRLLAAISIQPHVKKPIPPKKLLPLPWDDARRERKDKKPISTAEEGRKRFEVLIRRLGDERG